MVEALFPGCGKSHACKHMETLGYNVLFVCPTNELMRNYKNGITINKLFGMGISDDEKLKAFDTSEFNVIVFDEIYLHDIRKLSKIKKFCLNNPNKIIIATGDTCQIEPITELSNQKDYDIYANECVNNIFNVDVILKIPKRIKGEEQIKFIANLRIDIFSNTEDVNKRLEMIKKFKFKTTNKTFTPNNIAYFNSTCKKVSNNIRNQENRKNEYEIGEGLICKERTVIKPNVLNVNSKFVITKVCDNTVTIKDSYNSKIYSLPTEIIRKKIQFNYCSTCHSFQGSSIEGDMIIYDWKSKRADNKWLWTAITRATNLDNVYFYDDDSEDELTDTKLNTYFKNKVSKYKNQDIKALRIVPKDNYVDVEWLNNCVNKSCYNCCCKLSVEIDNEIITSNISAQRIDNNISHELSNIKACCVSCNCCFSNKENDMF